MVLTFILQLYINIVTWFLGFLPSATTLPFGVDSILVSGVGYLHFFIAIFPPLGTLLNAFLIYLVFIIGIKVVRLLPIIRHILD